MANKSKSHDSAPSVKIVVLDRGFVYVGRVTLDDKFCTITNAKNIRRWGTTQGLGELALKGPQPNTVLDNTGTVQAPMRAVLELIATEAALWNGI